jgi:hypothetical protein
MKKMLLVIPALLLCGCTGFGSLSKNLAEDAAIVKLKIGSPWGLQDVLRIGGTTNTVIITPDGSVTINPRTP